MVGYIVNEITRIFHHQLHFAALQIEPVYIEYIGTALVHADQEFMVHFLQIIDNTSPHTGKRRQVLRLAAD